MKGELGGKIIAKFVGLRLKTYSYLLDEGSEKKHKKVCHKERRLKFENYSNCLKAIQLINKINHLKKKIIRNL